jgi:hypothetical protein
MTHPRAAFPSLPCPAARSGKGGSACAEPDGVRCLSSGSPPWWGLRLAEPLRRRVRLLSSPRSLRSPPFRCLRRWRRQRHQRWRLRPLHQRSLRPSLRRRGRPRAQPPLRLLHREVSAGRRPIPGTTTFVGAARLIRRRATSAITSTASRPSGSPRKATLKNVRTGRIPIQAVAAARAHRMAATFARSIRDGSPSPLMTTIAAR